MRSTRQGVAYLSLSLCAGVAWKECRWIVTGQAASSGLNPGIELSPTFTLLNLLTPCLAYYEALCFCYILALPFPIEKSLKYRLPALQSPSVCFHSYYTKTGAIFRPSRVLWFIGPIESSVETCCFRGGLRAISLLQKSAINGI